MSLHRRFTLLRIYGAALLLAGVAAFPANGQKGVNRMKNGLKLEIAAVKESYGREEEVEVRIYLFNFADQPVTVNARLAVNGPDFPGEVSFHLVGPSGKPVPFSALVNVGKPQRADFSVVLPFHCAGAQTELRMYYNALGEPGKYTLKATYKNKWPGEDREPPAWTGSLDSNTITFQIKK